MKSNVQLAMVRARRGLARGFTLLEVMLAVVLFAAAITVLAAAYVNVLNTMELVKLDQALEQELALVRAQVLLEPELENVEAGGELPTATHGEATWTATVTPSEKVGDLFRIDLAIELSGDGETVPARRIEQSVHVLRPAWSQPSDRETVRNDVRNRLGELRRTRAL